MWSIINNKHARAAVRVAILFFFFHEKNQELHFCFAFIEEKETLQKNIFFHRKTIFGSLVFATAPPRMVAIDAAIDLGAEYERLTELRAGHRALDGRSTIHGV
jgi:hypothetical protein